MHLLQPNKVLRCWSGCDLISKHHVLKMTPLEKIEKKEKESCIHFGEFAVQNNDFTVCMSSTKVTKMRECFYFNALTPVT